MKKNLLKITIFLFFLLLIIPITCWGKLDLEYNYPKIPGTDKTITINTKLGDLIKYLINWVIIISGIIVFLTLIKEGIIYLTSMGNPAHTKMAQQRIVSSFLGLLILLSSYLLLKIINPQLILTKIEKKPIYMGIVLLSKEGHDDLIQGKKTLDELIFEQKAIYLRNSLIDLEDEFGGLSKQATSNKDIAPCNFDSNSYQDGFEYFKKFNLHSIGFFKDTEEKVKVFTFPDKKFQGSSSTVYCFNKNNCNSNLPTKCNYSPRFHGNLHIFQIPYFKESSNPNKLRPPLSIQISGTGPGVYLYAENGQELYMPGPPVHSGYANLKEVEFNDKTVSIKIENDSSKDDDFLVVLFDDKNFEDNFRMFFEKKERKYRGIKFEGGNIQNLTSTSVEGKDDYGKIGKNKTSSVKIFQISQDNNACRQVVLCSGPEFTDHCLVFVNQGADMEKIKDQFVNIFISTSTLPVFKPLPLKQSFHFEKFDENGKSIAKEDLSDFDNKITSLSIDGNCLVALFQNASTSDPHWPGGNSQIFYNDVNPESGALWPDLHGERIYNCGRFLGLSFTGGHSCASAVLIIPIKPIFGGGRSRGTGAGGSY